MSVAGRVAVVTGAASGQGRASAIRLAQEGARIAAIDLDASGLHSVAAEIRADGADCLTIEVDQSDADGVTEAFERIERTYGATYVLAAAAALCPKSAFSYERDWEETVRVLQVNLLGVIRCADEATRQMMAGGNGGRIILWSSIGASVSVGGNAAYCASKAGIEGLARALAVELGRYKITVNAIAPGAIDTPMIADFVPDEAYLDRVPAGRVGQPDDVAHLVSYLCSDAASFMTGAVLPLDGGVTRLHAALPSVM